MPWNNSGMASGAAQGAAAGSAIMPGWGTAIGAVAGGVMGGLSGGDRAPEAPVLPATRYPGAVSSPYGSMVYDPVTGSTRYIQNQSYGAYNPSSYQDAALYDALMGGTGASSGLTQQIQQQKLMLDQLKARGGGAQPTYADFNVIIDPNTGKPINYQDYINVQGPANPLWERFMKDTGGKYGSDNIDISFGKWAKDVANKEQAPALQSYENALKAYQSNSQAANDAIAQQELQLQQLQSMADDPGAAASSVSQNPLLMALKQQEDEANSPSYLKAMNAQSQNAYDNQLQQEQQALAARGLGSSGLAEMTRARMGLQLGNTMNQNALAAQQKTTDLRQSALNNRMNMLNFLSGRKDTGFSQGMQQQQLGMNQVNMGMGYGQNQLNNATQRDVAQAGLNSQYQLAAWNQGNAQNMQNQNQWASALGSIGYGMGNRSPSSSASTASGYGYGYTGNEYNPYGTTGMFGDNGAWASKR